MGGADRVLLDRRVFRRWVDEVAARLEEWGVGAVDCDLRELAELGRSAAPTAAGLLADPRESAVLRSRAFLKVAMAVDHVLASR